MEGEADDLVEVVLYGEMPPWPYTLAHADARLSADEKRRLADGLALTFGGSLPARGEGESEEEREDE